jgi:Tol biopolymer transport system component
MINESELPALSSPYLGQQVPGLEPEVFAPGVVTTQFHDDGGPAFSPDGREVYFRMAGWIRENVPEDIILVMRREGDQWSAPAEAPFLAGHDGWISGFSPDGSVLFFTSDRPHPESGEGQGFNLWTVRRAAEGWQQPRPLDAPIGNELNEEQASVAASGNIYFHSANPDADDVYDIFLLPLVEGSYAPPVILPAPVNLPETYDDSPCIASDESFLVFSSTRPGGLGQGDLYVTFREADGSWSQPANLGTGINSQSDEKFPSISPDGRYFFFVSLREYQGPARAIAAEYAELVESRVGPPWPDGGDIYWVSIGAVERLKPGGRQ